jgi:hypothetical protein
MSRDETGVLSKPEVTRIHSGEGRLSRQPAEPALSEVEGVPALLGQGLASSGNGPIA